MITHGKIDNIAIIGVARKGEVVYPTSTKGCHADFDRIEVGGSAVFAKRLFEAALGTSVQLRSAGVAKSRSMTHLHQPEQGEEKSTTWRIQYEHTFGDDVQAKMETGNGPADILVIYFRARDLRECGKDFAAELADHLRSCLPPKLLIVVAGAMPSHDQPLGGTVFETIYTIVGESFRNCKKLLVVGGRALRRAGYRIREDRSTSAAAEDLWKVFSKSATHPFHRLFDFIIVRLRSDVVIHISLKDSDPKGKIAYAIEADRLNWARFGETLNGFDCTLAASLVAECCKPGTFEDQIQVGIARGIKRLSQLLSHGYVTPPAALRPDEWFQEQWRVMDAAESNVNWLDIDSKQIEQPNRWRMIEACIHQGVSDVDQAVERFAHSIARLGCEQTRDQLKVPMKIFRLGAIETLDREEVDSLVSLQGLIHDYVRSFTQRNQLPRPLCLAVFGAPGSGKSFGVKQISKSLGHWGLRLDEHSIELNVAEFREISDLTNALHRVRDRCLKGSVPIAIFDEFDADFQGRSFGWLQHFLMPMQEGKFRDGREQFNTGSCILVFAGGINHTFAEFSGRKRDRAFCAAKGPDFISRLRGIHNVPPLNRDHDAEFPSWKIRRAILLQSFLKQKRRSITDDNLLRGLLNVSGFHHGARSLEAVLEMCASSKWGDIDVAGLPLRDQLDLHLDALEFSECIANTNIRI